MTRSIENNRLVCLDFDGVLADYRGWQGEWHAEPPVPGAREFVQKVRELGYTPVVHCSRPPEMVRQWLAEHQFPPVAVVETKPDAFLYIDYRGHRFDGKNWALAEDAITRKGWTWNRPSKEYEQASRERERERKRLAKEHGIPYTKGVVALALDQVLSQVQGGQLQDPVPGAREFVDRVMESGYEPVVYTHRSKVEAASWLHKHGFPSLRIWNSKREPFCDADAAFRNNKIKVIIESRGFRFEGDNWDEALEILREGGIRPVCVIDGPYRTPRRLLFLDTETTGLSRVRNRIVQLAMILVEDGQIRERFAAYVHPEGGEVEPDASLTTGIEVEGGRVVGVRNRQTGELEPVRAISQKEAMAAVARLLTPDTVLVCHNVPFDLGFLLSSLKREGFDPWTGTFICTLSMWRYLEKRRFDAEVAAARAAYQAGDSDAFSRVVPMGSGRLVHVCERLGIPFDEAGAAHDALYDVEKTIEVYNRIRPMWEAISFDPRNVIVQLRSVKADWIPPGADVILISSAMPDDMKEALKGKSPKPRVKAADEEAAQETAAVQSAPAPTSGGSSLRLVLDTLAAAARQARADVVEALSRSGTSPRMETIRVRGLDAAEVKARLKVWPFIQVQSVTPEEPGCRVTVPAEFAWAARALLIDHADQPARTVFSKVSFGLERPERIRWIEGQLRSWKCDYYKGSVMVGTGADRHPETYFLVRSDQADSIRVRLSAAAAGWNARGASTVRLSRT